MLTIRKLTDGFSIPVIKAGSLRNSSLLSNNLVEGLEEIDFFRIGLQRIEKGAFEGISSHIELIRRDSYLQFSLFSN